MRLTPLLLLLSAAAAATDVPVDYSRDVRPIFAEHCTQCHGPDEGKREADLYLDHPDSLSSVVAPGAPDESALFYRVSSKNPRLRMPPASHAEALDPGEIDVLRRWIEQGAGWQPHWAYAPFRAVEPPRRSEPHPIDRFVRARLERAGLEPSPPADRRTLIRRLSLDLIGMVPTPEEIDTFLADSSTDAYDDVVDRLLDSPHYAERWARHWLDLARYADSNGFTIDGRRDMWPYRDWVVRAIAQDMPFDQFTIEQLAGDLLPEPSNAQLVATGFHRNTQINQEGGAKDEENRVNAVIDRVNTTGAVWLGSTLACAQCHTHKYDPVTHAEYYQMLAFFNQTADGGVSTGPRVAVTDERTRPQLEAFEARREELAALLVAAERNATAGWTAWRPRYTSASEGPELRVLADASILSVAHNPQTSLYELEGPAPIPGISAIRIDALPDFDLRELGPGRARSGGFAVSSVRVFSRATGSQDEWREHALRDPSSWEVLSPQGQPHAAAFRLAEALPPNELDLHVELAQNHGTNHVLGRFRVSFTSGVAEASVTQEWRDAWNALVAHEEERPDLPTALVMREQSPPRTTHVFQRGSFLDPGDEVSADVPAAFNHFAPQKPPGTRLELARWLVHPDNALVHRVTVNRWWQRFFGLGLVSTENDFGVRGAAPSHPDLLEWLARELVDQRFSMKAIHRLIVTSETYKQASSWRQDIAERDPGNLWLGRQSRLRLDAEAIRDSALRASGLLSTEIGGPPVQPPQPEGVFSFTQRDKKWVAEEGANRYRRTLYVRIWRSSPYPFLTTFDAPQPNVTCTRRIPSSTPLQALTLANDPMMLELTEGLARRLMKGIGSPKKRIRRAWEMALGRPPTAEEELVMLDFLQRERSRVSRSSAWSAVARVLFNLDEFSHRS